MYTDPALTAGDVIRIMQGKKMNTGKGQSHHWANGWFMDKPY